MMNENWWLPTTMLAALAACSSSASEETQKPVASLRPGVEDSNAAYKGTASENESAFWVAVRSGDDVARDAAVTRLTADVAGDPKNGYSHFLVGANAFMAPSGALRALANGTDPPAGAGPSLQSTGPAFERALANLSDPFYLGFAGGLLASLELRAGNVAQGGPRFAAAARNNAVATGFISVLGDFAAQDAKKALEDHYTLIEYCNGGPVDRSGADAGAFVAKQNAGSLKQRECYSGYHAPHGSPGLMLILADLHALNGQPAAAKAYYDALTRANDYPTWPLRPLVERRREGEAVAFGQAAAIAGTCGTCHTNALP